MDRNKELSYTRSGWLDLIDLSSSLIFLRKNVFFLREQGIHTSSGLFEWSLSWFDWIAPSLTASLQAIEGVRVLYEIVGLCSRALNFSNYISSRDTKCAGCTMHYFGEVQAQ